MTGITINNTKITTKEQFESSQLLQNFAEYVQCGYIARGMRDHATDIAKEFKEAGVNLRIFKEWYPAPKGVTPPVYVIVFEECMVEINNQGLNLTL